MTKELFIRMVKDNVETELTVSRPSESLENTLLAGVLSFMDIELSENLLKIQKMYTDFYDGTFNHEFMETNEEICAVITKEENTLTEKDLYEQGLKYDAYKKLTYKCRYRCGECNYTGTHYILPRRKVISCHKCREQLLVYSPEVSPDAANVHFYAGIYKK